MLEKNKKLQMDVYTQDVPAHTPTYMFSLYRNCITKLNVWVSKITLWTKSKLKVIEQ